MFNLTLDNKNISNENLQEAILRTRAGDVVERIGWEEMREGGGDVSVGEGQLLTFARMMAHQPAGVILDEATASIDSITESKIQEAIDEIFSSKTVIVVAHRLSTIQSRSDYCVWNKDISLKWVLMMNCYNKRADIMNLLKQGSHSLIARWKQPSPHDMGFQNQGFWMLIVLTSVIIFTCFNKQFSDFKRLSILI